MQYLRVCPIEPLARAPTLTLIPTRKSLFKFATLSMLLDVVVRLRLTHHYRITAKIPANEIFK